MRRIPSPDREHPLSVTGQFKKPPPARTVGHSNPPQLHVVFRRNADFGMDFQTGISMAKLGSPLRENRLVTFRRAQGGLIRCGPEFSCCHIAQIDERSPAISRAILPPA